MKSKMKSAFALIAVALMIMVAVVPMVGVLTSDSDADIISVTDPSMTTDEYIKVKVILKDATGTAISTTIAGDAGKVKITYGAYSQSAEIAEAAKTSGNTFNLFESSVASARISYVDSKGVENNDYPAVTIDNLSAGNTYNVSLQAGYIVSQVKLGFKNPTEFSAANLNNTEISGSYNIYDSNAEDAQPVYTNEFVVDNYKVYVKYPSSYAGKTMYYAVTSFNSSYSLSFTETKVAVGTTNQASADQYLYTIKPQNVMIKELTINSITPATGTETFTPILSKIKYVNGTTGDIVALFASKQATSSAVTITLYDGVTTNDLAVASLGATTTLSGLTGYISGTVKLDTSTKLVQEGTLNYTITPASGDSDITGTAMVDSTGTYFKFVTGYATTGTPLKATFSVSGISEPMTTTVNTGYVTSGANIMLVASDWAYISGAVTIAAGHYVVGKELTVVGSEVFGYTVTKASGAFEFAAKKGTSLTFSASSASLSGDVNITIPNSSSAVTISGIALTMSTQELTVNVVDAYSKPIASLAVVKLITIVDDVEADVVTTATDGQLIWDGVSKTYKAYVREDLTASSLYVYVNDTAIDYKFANHNKKTALNYTEGMDVKSKIAEFKLTFYEADGTAIDAAAKTTSGVEIYNASAYVNSTSANTVYDLGTEIVPTTSGKVYSFYAELSKMNVETITSTPVDVVIVKLTTDKTVMNAGIFKSVYALDADEGVISIVASVDSFTAKLTRLDGVTPISGVKAELIPAGSTTVIDTSYTQEDGTFTVYSDSTLTYASGERIRFGEGQTLNYDFTITSVYEDATTEREVFKSTADEYYVAFMDADGAVIDVATNWATVKPTLSATTNSVATNATPVGVLTGTKNVAVYKAAWTDETSAVTVAYAGSSFPAYILTDDDLSLGVIGITSYQETYTFKTVDANGKALPTVTLNLYKYWGDQPVDTGVDITTGAGPTNKGVTTYRLPISTDDFDTEYAVLPVKENYAFSIVPQDVDAATVKVESYYAEISYYVVDAAGMPLRAHTNPATTKIFKNGVEIISTAQVTELDVLKFINDPEADYTVSVAKTEGTNIYSFASKQAPEDGLLYAKEEWVIGDIQNALGVSIGTNTTKVKAYYSATSQSAEATYVAETTGYYYEILVDVDAALYYYVSAMGGIDARYDSLENGAPFETPLIVADEMPIAPVLETLNGTAAMPTAYTLTAYNEYGKILDSAATIIVDPELVDEYVLNVTTAGDNYFPVGKYSSDSFVFMSNFVRITGSLPVATDSAADYILIEKYLDDEVVATQIVPFAGANISTYEAFVNMEGYTADVGAVEFDSIYATYVYKGAIYCTTAIDPTSVFNPIVVPGTIVYTVSKIGSALFQMHWDVEIADGVAVLTAEPTFYVADDEAIYTDGQYKYTFAGWFVDGEKVSDAADFSFLIVADAAVSAQYNVTYEKISDANKDVEKEFVNIVEEVEVPVEKTVGIDTNVLIIGICAVIVALIAVVYAVIKKD